MRKSKILGMALIASFALFGCQKAVVPEEPAGLKGAEISFEGAERKGDAFYLSVRNSESTFRFLDFVKVANSATWSVSTDRAGKEAIPTKTVELQPGSNNYFISVSNEAAAAQSTYTVDIYRNHIFTVTFDSDGGTPCSPVEVEEGFTIKEEDVPTPTKAGYSLTEWDVDLSAPITSDLTATALWTPIRNKLSVTSQDEAKGTVQIVSGTGVTGEQITVQATPAQDCIFRGWYSSDGQEVSSDNPYSFEMPSSDYSLEARFWTEAEEAAWIIAHVTKPVLSEDGKALTYGLYPQKHVSGTSLIESLNSIASPEANGWYLLNGKYYAKQTAKPYSPDYRYDDGTLIAKDSCDWFLCEPIEWKVLSSEAGETLIVSSLLLDAHRYDDSSNNYKGSEVRQWLNSEFLDSAFCLDSSSILTATVDNSAATTDSATNPYACEDTQDKVFLLSYQDYKNASYGFSDDASRKCRATDWAMARGASSSSSSQTGCYWTRSPLSSRSDFALGPNADGYLNVDLVGNEHNCVRPGLRAKVA